DDAGRQVRDADGGVRLVDVLAARAGGAESVDAQVRRIQLDLLDLVLFRQDGNGDRGGMNASLRLGGRHALHAMGARFEFQLRESASAGDARDDLFITAVLPGALVEDFYGESLGLRVAAIHP